MPALRGTVLQSLVRADSATELLRYTLVVLGALGIVPEDFPQQIRTGNRVSRSTSVRPEGSMPSCGQTSARAFPS